MSKLLQNKSLPVRELLFQLILHGVVFIFYSFDRNQPTIASHQ